MKSVIGAGELGADELRKIGNMHLTRAIEHYSDFVVGRGEGSWVFEAGDTGRKALDFSTGYATASTGHCHPRVVQAISEQAGRLIHGNPQVFALNEPLGLLLCKLAKVMPEGLDNFALVNSGSEAVEFAVKTARMHTGRDEVICFQGGYHGRTFGASALSSSEARFRMRSGPKMPGVHTAPFSHCMCCSASSGTCSRGCCSCTKADCCDWSLRELHWMLKTECDPSDVAAIIIEPILGEAGVLEAPEGLLDGIRQICSEHGIIMIVDEIQSGSCRTGKWWAHEQMMHDGMPDMMLFGKGIGSGIPIAGIATRKEVFDSCHPGAIGGTFVGNPIAAACACATIDVLCEENLCQNACERGKQMMEGLMKLKDKNMGIVDVRGRGLMMAVQFSDECPGMKLKVMQEALNRELLLLPAGPPEILRLLPPLTVTAEEVDMALSKFEEAIAACK